MLKKPERKVAYLKGLLRPPEHIDQIVSAFVEKDFLLTPVRGKSVALCKDSLKANRTALYEILNGPATLIHSYAMETGNQVAKAFKPLRKIEKGLNEDQFFQILFETQMPLTIKLFDKHNEEIDYKDVLSSFTAAKKKKISMLKTHDLMASVVMLHSFLKIKLNGEIISPTPKQTIEVLCHLYVEGTQNDGGLSIPVKVKSQTNDSLVSTVDRRVREILKNKSTLDAVKILRVDDVFSNSLAQIISFYESNRKNSL